ncbi:UNVERIFIED_ORG: general secretion pathway protein D [Xanthobacter viscosus]|uniref:Type II secretion system protein GspD n=1 Tax=Xanthobacter autotrophicus TaxID=280 RepID=A0A6C1KQI1_XANAU|nr:type II secretion system secretin GspD [Xanthobacter autotrophicus]TLX42006.1 type II secretion system protein GspD [Xanthobacter autotrophicus]
MEVRKDRPNRFGSRPGTLLLTCAILIATALAACSLVPDDVKPPSVMDQVRAIDLLPRDTKPVPGPQDIPDDRKAIEYFGSSTSASVSDRSEVGVAGRGGVSGGADGYDLNFDNTPVTSVAKVVLGDILGVGYVIDPRVQGTVTLASARPVPKTELLYVLETALKTNNVAMVREASGYRLVPLTEAAGGGNADVGTSRPEPGYGISVVPLRYVSAEALMPLLDSFATKAGAVRADPGRNLLIIQGTGAERQSAINTVLSFDADWMRGQSVGVYPVRNSAPEALISELESIMDAGDSGLSHKMVKFQAITRLNAIMVVAKKPELLQTAGTWIGRLDRSDTTVGVRVYRLRYGDAKQTAKVLNDLFVGGSSSGLDQAASQIAPGSGASVSSGGGSDGNGSGSGLTVQQRLGQSPPKQDTGGSGGKATAVDSEGAPLGGSGGGSGGGGALLPGIRITADAVNNSLLIFASQENYRIIERTLMQLDQPQMQVAIEATVAEVTLNDTLAYGVQFYLTSKDLGLGRNNGSVLNTLSGEITDQAINRVLPGFNLLVGRENQPRAILDALHTVTDVKVLSNPSVVVVDNQKATLQVGDEVPVSTGSATVLSSSNTVVNTIEYKNTGIILHVVPRVNVNGQVRLEIEQEISNVTQSDPTTSGTSSNSTGLTPTVSQRKVKSVIAVASGQTVLLAGLISERHNGVRQGVPILDQIPGVGDAFAHTTGTVKRTELIIFIRPQIIRDNVDAHTVAEELRAKLRGTVTTLPGGPQAPLGAR